MFLFIVRRSFITPRRRDRRLFRAAVCSKVQKARRACVTRLSSAPFITSSRHGAWLRLPTADRHLNDHHHYMLAMRRARANGMQIGGISSHIARLDLIARPPVRSMYKNNHGSGLGVHQHVTSQITVAGFFLPSLSHLVAAAGIDLYALIQYGAPRQPEKMTYMKSSGRRHSVGTGAERRSWTPRRAAAFSTSVPRAASYAAPPLLLPPPVVEHEHRRRRRPDENRHRHVTPSASEEARHTHLTRRLYLLSWIAAHPRWTRCHLYCTERNPARRSGAMGVCR